MSEGRERLDHYLVRERIAASRRAANDLISSGGVTVNGRRPRKGDLVSSADVVEVVSRATDEQAIAPDASTDIELLYEDSAVIVVNKPGGIPCHPLRAGETGTMMNAVAARFPEAAASGPKPLEGGLVHRLDNGTSGALIIARTREAREQLHAAIRSGAVSRTYQALVAGKLTRKLTLDTPIAHHPKNPKLMTLGDSDSINRKRAGRPAHSIVEPLRAIGQFMLVKVSPGTGSRHQIRVHLASAGYPIVGDTLYGGPSHEALTPDRFWLHLSSVVFESPAGGTITVAAPLPADLQSLIR